MRNKKDTGGETDLGDTANPISGITWVMIAVFALIVLVGILFIGGFLASAPDGNGNSSGNSPSGRPTAAP